LLEELENRALPRTLDAHHETVLRLARAYKQINAPVGALGLLSLGVSTRALASGDAQNDGTYTQIEDQLQSLTGQRDALALQMANALNRAEFGGQAIDEQAAKKLIDQAQGLIAQLQ